MVCRAVILCALCVASALQAQAGHTDERGNASPCDNKVANSNAYACTKTTQHGNFFDKPAGNAAKPVTAPPAAAQSASIPLATRASSAAQASSDAFFLGLEGTVSRFFEEGLDQSKGEYSTAYTTLGGSIAAQYHFTDYFFDAGIGLMNFMSLTVNSYSVDMSNRSQWQLPVYAHAFYKFNPYFSLGTGLTHLTELSMYVDSQKVPNSSYNHLFVDLAAQFSPQLTQNLRLALTALVGLNLIPGRQNTYAIGDLLHVRFQMNVALLYRIF